MTFLEAKAKLDEMAQDIHHKIEYGVSYHPIDGSTEVECSLTVVGVGHVNSTCWEEAFRILDRMKPKYTVFDSEEAPQ